MSASRGNFVSKFEHMQALYICVESLWDIFHFLNIHGETFIIIPYMLSSSVPTMYHWFIDHTRMLILIPPATELPTVISEMPS